VNPALIASVAAAALLAGWRPAPSRWPAPTSPSSGCPTRSPGGAYAGTAVLLLAAAAVGGPWPALVRALLGGLALAGFYLLLMVVSPSGMSLGDVKLAASLGTLLAWFGWRLLLAGGFAGFLLGGVFAAALLAGRRAGRKQPIPFGPFMIAGAVLAVVAQPGR
jgi:prepilin signal peptidase PulO-like enzyme (type II secretory pathway)